RKPELSDSISIQPLQQTDLPSVVSLYNVSYADTPEFFLQGANKKELSGFRPGVSF
ncbi:hypothetical protein HKBW3S44_01348, partial [Candidatus Hakubella thermalkaliphila]